MIGVIVGSDFVGDVVGDGLLERWVRGYGPGDRIQSWLAQQRDRHPHFACVLGFTATGLVPGISAAGATPDDRRYTALADAEFLVNGPTPGPRYPLPPLHAGASPVLITRAVVTAWEIPVEVIDAGLPVAPAVPTLAVGGEPARCLQTGRALDRAVVDRLWAAGLAWGEARSRELATSDRYLILSECVVGGTSTALAVLLGLGIAAAGMVNSSHPACNHAQKLALVQQGLAAAGEAWARSPLAGVAAVGDPMQVFVAGAAIAASRRVGVLLAGGTQMLAVYALARAIATAQALPWNPAAIAIGTTRWVAADPTGDTPGLVAALGQAHPPTAPILLATQLSLAASPHATLRAYEQGFVKEGVGAGGCAIAAHLLGWDGDQLRQAVDQVAAAYGAIVANGVSRPLA
jgi:uncharacterized protein (TIGR00303 family)